MEKYSKRKKVVLYCRVTYIAEISATIATQEETLEKYADSHNYEIVDVMKEI